MSAKLQIRVGNHKGSKGTRKRARGSPPNPQRTGYQSLRVVAASAYGLFRNCGVAVEYGADLKACLSRVLEERPLDLLGKCCDRKAVFLVQQALRCDRQEALLEIYLAMRLSGKNSRDGILAWNPAIGGLVPYLKRGSLFAARKLCAKEERSPWGRTVSLEEPRYGSDSDPDGGTPTTYLECLAAKPEPGVCVCGRY